MFNAISNVTGYKYDFIVQKKSEFEKAKFSRRKRLQIFSVPAWVISLEDLILSKLICMQESESIIQKNNIVFLLEDILPDLKYIRTWIKKLNLKTFDIRL